MRAEEASPLRRSFHCLDGHVFTEGNPRDRLRGIGWRLGAIGDVPWQPSEQLGYRPCRTFNGKPGSYNFRVDARARGEIFVQRMGDSIVRCRPALGGPLTVVLVPMLDANANTSSWTCKVHKGDGSTDPACVPANGQTPYERS